MRYFFVFSAYGILSVLHAAEKKRRRYFAMEAVTDFEWICEIKPVTDEQGQIIEYYPSEKYRNQSGKKLHKYGQGPFCRFRIPDTLNKKGVYILLVNHAIKYVGECENLSQRFNLGYGLISPRNCYEGGQPTNCKINSYILQEIKKGSKVCLFFRETEDRFKLERELIQKYKPEWNVAPGKYTGSSGRKPAGTCGKEDKHIDGSNKYHLLEQYLAMQKDTRIELTFSEIEKIIGDTLPLSAYKYRAWWANGGHKHSSAWRLAGWRVDGIKPGKAVVFIKG